MPEYSRPLCTIASSKFAKNWISERVLRVHQVPPLEHFQGNVQELVQHYHQGMLHGVCGHLCGPESMTILLSPLPHIARSTLAFQCIQETAVLSQKLHLESVNFPLACDLKFGNIIRGLQNILQAFLMSSVKIEHHEKHPDRPLAQSGSMHEHSEKMISHGTTLKATSAMCMNREMILLLLLLLLPSVCCTSFTCDYAVVHERGVIDLQHVQGWVGMWPGGEWRVSGNIQRKFQQIASWKSGQKHQESATTGTVLL